MIINKQADFVVRIARNLQDKTKEERDAAMAALSPKIQSLVRTALTVFNKRKQDGIKSK